MDFAGLPVAAEFGAGPFAREDYLLRSTNEGVWLIGATAVPPVVEGRSRTRELASELSTSPRGQLVFLCPELEHVACGATAAC